MLNYHDIILVDLQLQVDVSFRGGQLNASEVVLRYFY